MAKDYAKYQSKKNKPKWARWVIFLVLILIFSLFLIHLEQKRTEIKKIKQVKVVQVKIPTNKKDANKQQIKFDFYTILPKEKVNIPSSSSPNITKGQYFLQIASIKSGEKDANKLKEQLALLGFDAYVDKFTTDNGDVWNRVNVGPYVSLIAARADQEKLKQNNIDSILRQIK